MRSLIASALLALAPCKSLPSSGRLPSLTQTVTQLVSAQSSAPTAYEDPDTGIIFDTWTSPSSDITFGFALPTDALDVDATEYIGYIVSSLNGVLPGKTMADFSLALWLVRRRGHRLVRSVARRLNDQQPSRNRLPQRG